MPSPTKKTWSHLLKVLQVEHYDYVVRWVFAPADNSGRCAQRLLQINLACCN